MKLADFKRRYEFTTTILLFFPVVLSALYGSTNSVGDKTILRWGFVIAVMVLGYIALEVRSPKKSWVLEGVNILLILELFVVAVALSIFPNGDQQASGWRALAYVVDFGAVLVIPLVICAALILSAAMQFIDSLFVKMAQRNRPRDKAV